MHTSLSPITCLPPRPPKPIGRPATRPGNGAKPRPRPARPLPPAPRPASFAERPLFGVTNQLGQAIQKPRNPIDAPLGVVVMPLAVTMDLFDLVTRPLQAIFIR